MKILHELMAPYSHYHMDHFLSTVSSVTTILQQYKSLWTTFSVLDIVLTDSSSSEKMQNV